MAADARAWRRSRVHDAGRRLLASVYRYFGTRHRDFNARSGILTHYAVDGAGVAAFTVQGAAKVAFPGAILARGRCEDRKAVNASEWFDLRRQVAVEAKVGANALIFAG